jgi:cardiolipin synthase A/B
MSSDREPSTPRRRPPVWLLILAVTGAVSIGAIVLDTFVGVGRRAALTRATQAPAAGSPDFMRALSGALNAPVGTGGTVAVLDNGREFYPALLEAIRAAQRSINFSVYIWQEGEPSDAVVAALLERARQGVQVRILLDGFGGKGMPDATREALQTAGAQVKVFRPLKFGQITRYHRRNHRRAIVMDGTVGFTGGMAVAPQWLGDAEDPEHWRDMMVRLTGPAATHVQSAFADVWAYATGEMLAGDAFFPDWSQSPPAEAPAGPAQASSRPLVHTGVSSAPSKEDHPLGLLFLLTFSGARQRLYVATPYFMPDLTTRTALIERARAGVDVRILLPNELTDAAPVRLASQRHYEELLAGGVRIWEYQPTFLHAKWVVVDGTWSVVGSANLNVRSRELDHENVVGLLDAALGRRLEEDFARDLGRAREIRLEDWRRRGWWQKLKERVCSAMAQVS